MSKRLSIAIGIIVVLLLGWLGVVQYGSSPSPKPDDLFSENGNHASTTPQTDENVQNPGNGLEVIADGDYAVSSFEEEVKAQAAELLARPITFPPGTSPSVQASVLGQIGVVKEFLHEHTTSVDGWIEFGNYLKVIGDYDGAVQSWELAGLLDESNYLVFHNLGDLYAFTLGSYAMGEQFLVKSVELEPANVHGYLALASLYQQPQFGSADKIENILSKGIMANPLDVTLHVRLAQFYRDQGSIEQAINYFEKALALNPPQKEAIQEELDALQFEQS